MGIISPKTTADRYLHALTGCIPDLEGDVTLAPANHFLNWRFDDLDSDNAPDGLEIGRPEDPEGFFVYVSDKNGGPSSLTSQTLEPIDLDEDTFHINHDPVDGAAPRTSQFAAQIAAPDSPTLTKVPASSEGWAAGTYRVSYTWIDDQDRHTALAPVSTVTLGLGQFIRIFLPTSAPDGAVAIGIWVTSANGGVSTLRLQTYVYVSIDFPESILLRGPYTIKKSTPASNETEEKPPKKPKGKKHKGRGGKAKKGRYRARLRKRNRRNGKRSKPSEWSDPVDISQDEANKGIGFGVETGQTGSFDIEVEKDGKRHRLTDKKSGGKHSKRPHRKKKRRRHRGGKGKKSTHHTSGHTANEGGNLSDDAADTGQEVEDLVDDPSSPLDSVLPEGQIIISPGTYWVAISYYVRGEETLPSPPVQITISTGQTIRVHFPDANNGLINSQLRDLNANNNPDGWTITGSGGTGGTHSVNENGMLTLDTLGAKTGTASSPVLYQDYTVSREEFYAIGGMISATLVSGSFVVDVEEFSSGSSLLRVTNLITLPSSGSYISFKKVFGSGSGYTSFHPDTDFVRLVAKFSGSTRQGTTSIHELYINPHSSVRLRRLVQPVEEEEFVDSDPPEFVRWSKQSITGVGLPPSTGGTTLAPLNTLDFESTDLAGWTLRQSTVTGTTALREGPAAISGSFGYRMQKDTSSSAYTYLSRYMGDQSNIALNFKVRVASLPNKSYVDLGAIGVASNDGHTNKRIMCQVGYDGSLWYGTRTQSAVNTWAKVSSGIHSGDVLDIELRIINFGTSKATAIMSWGKNGASRTASKYRTNQDLGGPAAWVTVGAFSLDDTSLRYTLHYDDFVVTRTGAYGALNTQVPEGLSYSAPDRPLADVTEIESVSFDSGSLPTGWTSSRTPTDSTTAVAVETAAKIDGTHGVRCTDTGTATSASAYITHTFSPTLTGAGIRARIRVVSLPGTGNITLMQARSSGGQVLASLYLDNSGALYAQSFKSDTTLFKQTRIYTGITAGTILTLEMVLAGLATEGGELSVFASRGGSGAVAERSQYVRHQVLPWSTLNLSAVRIGIVAESAVLATSTLHVDSVRITGAGEIIYSERDSLGNNIYQTYYYYPQGTPQQDDLGLKGLELAVQPEETYTVALKARHADVPTDTPAFPYTFYVYDQSGKKETLGSLYGEGGATGSMDWTDLTQTWTIPQDSYVLTMESPGISSGEFVAQELAISRGTSASREVIYPDTGQVWIILDTETPQSFAFAPRGANPIENRWLDIGTVVNLAEGTSATVQYNSADPVYDASGDILFTGTEQPTSWLSDPLALTPHKYAHILLTLNASSDLRATPTLAAESPYVDFYTRIGGERVNTLLREDLSEFDGGVYLTWELSGYRELSQFDVRQPLGRVRRHRMWDPVGEINDLHIFAYTMDAVREIEENCLSLDFAIETQDYRLLCRFREQVNFSISQPPKKIQGVWCCVAEATVDGVEVYERLSIEPLVDSLVAP